MTARFWEVGDLVRVDPSVRCLVAPDRMSDDFPPIVGVIHAITGGYLMIDAADEVGRRYYAAVAPEKHQLVTAADCR